MMLRIPIGTEDFKDIREQFYFVDKSSFISEFFRRRAAVTLITRPRRFGKTLTLSMMKYFLDLENAEENRKLFDGLRVTEDAAAMQEQGTRPVVFLTLKNFDGSTWEEMQDSFAYGMQSLFLPFKYLLDCDKIAPEDKELFRKVCKEEAGVSALRYSLDLLLRMLHAFYGKRAVLLLDEYDAPLQNAWDGGYYPEAIKFFRFFFSSAFKTNPSLDFAILTGVLRIAKESIFSGLNNLKVSTVVSGGYADAFGYTKDDIAKMAQDLGHADKVGELADWYDGYDFQGVDIYNPWSVNNYFEEGCRPAPYWLNTSGNAILSELLAHIDETRAAEIEQLIDGKTVTVNLDEAFVYDDIGKNSDDLYTLLLFTGYLKCVRTTMEDDEFLCELAIPNREIRSLYRREIKGKFSGTSGRSILLRMTSAMERGDDSAFSSCLQKILRDMASVHDTAKPESFYHGLMLGLTVWLNTKYRIRSNRESGYGRFDLALFPNDRQLPGILMEFKSVGDESKLELAADAACQQMQEREYTSALKEEGIRTIWCYGIAFCKKRVAIHLAK